MTLTFDFNVILLIVNFYSNLHAIDNHCAIYEYPRLNIKAEFDLQAVDMFSYIYLTMTLNSRPN